MRRRLLFLLAALLLWPAVASAETPAEYRSALAETMRAAELAMATVPGDRSLADYAPLRQALLRLEAIGRVTTESGASITVDNRAIVKQLRDSRAEGRQASEALGQLIRAVDESMAPTNWTRDDARATLAEVLARTEFRGDPGSSVERFLKNLRGRLFAWLESLFPGISLPELPGGDLGKPVNVVFWLIAGAVAVFAIVFFALTLRGARRSLVGYASLQEGKRAEQEDAADARLAAQKAAESGDYRSAVHYLYLWAILHLAESSRLRYDRSLTNREQLRAIAASGEATQLARTAADAFDRLWYGHVTCTEAEYGQFRHTLERLVGAATS